MRSLRFRLLALWIMLVVSGAATAYLLFESFRQTSNARVARSEELVARACRDIADRYQFFVSGWSGARVDDRLRQELVNVIQAALSNAVGVEGGIWQGDAGSLAYAFPSYEGTGPKTDLPAAEQNTIREVNAEALRSGRPAGIRQPGRSQVLLVHACPLRGPLQGVTAWTMVRTFTAEGPAYNQLLAGLAVLVLTIFGSAVWLARVLFSWSRKIALIEQALGNEKNDSADLPTLPRTGEQELDRLVDALNDTGERLARERQRASAAERLAAVGRLSAGLAHEIRNPIAAMRLKAENALAAGFVTLASQAGLLRHHRHRDKPKSDAAPAQVLGIVVEPLPDGLRLQIDRVVIDDHHIIQGIAQKGACVPAPVPLTLKRLVEAGKEAFDDPFGDELEPTKLRDLEWVQQIEPWAGRGGDKAMHAAFNRRGVEGRRQSGRARVSS